METKSNMNAQEAKARELFELFMRVYPHRGMARRAASLCIEEIKKERKELGFAADGGFWKAVKKLIDSSVKLN